MNSLSLQGIVSGSNFPSVLTNDPATTAALDPTISALDLLRSVRELPATGEAPDGRNGAIVAALVALVMFASGAVVRMRRRNNA